MMSGLFAKHFLLNVPKLLGKIHIISMGIFKALYLIPELVCLSGAVAADVRCRGRGVNAFSVLKNRYKQLAQMVIRDGFALPSVLRIKDFERLCFVNRFVIDAKQVGNGFAAVVVIDSVYFFIVRVCDFSRFSLILIFGSMTPFFSVATSLYTPPKTGSLLAVMRRRRRRKRRFPLLG